MDDIQILKENIKNQIGKVPHYVASKAHSGVNRLAHGITNNVNIQYNHGIASTQKNPVIDKIAETTEGLTERNKDELLKNRDSTFRTIRKSIITGTFILTPFIIGIPIMMIDEAIQNNVDIDNAAKYDKVFTKEIEFTDKEIAKRKKEGKSYDDLTKYRANLIKSRLKMRNHIDRIRNNEKESNKEIKSTKEALIIRTDPKLMNPLQRFVLIQREHFDSDEKFDEVLIESFSELVRGGFMANDYTGIINKVKSVEEASEFISNDYKKRQSAYIIIKGNLFKFFKENHNMLESFENHLRHKGQFDFINGTVDSLELFGFKESSEKINQLIKNINENIRYTGCSVSSKMIDNKPVVIIEGVVDTAQNVVRKGVNTVRNVLPDENPVKSAERITEPADSALNNIINGIKSAITSDKRDEILHGKFRVKLIRIIAKCIAVGGLYYIHPALAAIGVLGKLAFDKYIDHSERTKILHDMESELEIVEEKIKDADGNGDNENKYKLMRIRKSLQTETNRIKLHIDK